jgi:hypothetical protein
MIAANARRIARVIRNFDNCELAVARCGRLGAQIAHVHKERDLVYIEARFVAWRSKGHFDIKAEGGGHHGWENGPHRIGVRVLLFVTSGGAGPFDGAGPRAVSPDPDDPSATA